MWNFVNKVLGSRMAGKPLAVVACVLNALGVWYFNHRDASHGDVVSPTGFAIIIACALVTGVLASRYAGLFYPNQNLDQYDEMEHMLRKNIFETSYIVLSSSCILVAVLISNRVWVANDLSRNANFVGYTLLSFLLGSIPSAVAAFKNVAPISYPRTKRSKGA